MRTLAALSTCLAVCASACVQPPAAAGHHDDDPASAGGALVAEAHEVEGTASPVLPAVADSLLNPAPVAAPAKPITAPVALTASDGTGLEIVAYVAKAVVEDPLAFTEIHLTFHNPRPAPIEGQFTITLPPGAAVSRFAMKQPGGWQEGEVVELQAARQAYEDFLHRRQDPALLEKQAGNQFHARVFPIPASGDKELIVSYSQELARAKEPYRLPLRGLPKLRSLEIRALVGKHEVGAQGASTLGGTRVANETVEVKKTDFMPDSDFEVPLVAPDGGRRLGLRHDNVVVARLAPVADEAKEPVQSLLVLFDTSASRALDFAADVDRVGEVIAELGRVEGSDVAVSVAAFDQEIEEIYRGSAAGFGAGEKAKLVERRALGASDLGKALAWAAHDSHAGSSNNQAVTPPSQQQQFSRVLLVSDGVATAGKLETGELRALVTKLGAAGVKRLDAMKSGGLADETGLHELVTAGLAHDGIVVDTELGAGPIVQKLGRATFSNVHVEVPGSRWSWPETLDGMQSGDEVLVYADLPPEQNLEVQLSGAMTRQQQFLLVETERPLLERAWVGARIAKLVHQQGTLAAKDADLRSALRHEIIDLSTKHRVLSDYTGLLVLETEWDYQRFHIDRRALSDIMVVGSSGIELAGRRGVGTGPRDRAEVAAQTSTKSATPPWARHAAATGKQDKKEKAADENSGFDQAPRGGLAEMEQQHAVGDSPRSVATPTPVVLAPPASPMAPSHGEYASGGGGQLGGRSQPLPRPAKSAGPSASSEMMPDLLAGRGQSRGYAAPPAMAMGSSSAPMAADGFDGAGSLALRARSDGDRDHARTRVAEERRAQSAPHGSIGRVAIGDPMGNFDEVRIVPPRQSAAVQAAQSGMLGIMRSTPAAATSEAEEVSPYEGKFARAMSLLKKGDKKAALHFAQAWRSEQPGDVLALIALGEAAESLGDKRQAARAYGSLIDLFPSRADLRRFAGERLDRLGPAGLELAIDTYRQARAQRPDHPSSHRLLAYALLRAGRAHEAFDVIAAGLRRTYPEGRFAGVERVLREDAGLIAAAWARREPKNREQIVAKLESLGATLDESPSLRFVLNWETDANDVDFHIEDAQGGHAWYASRTLPSGGELYADVTTGYGPECFTIPGAAAAFPYRLRAHYYSRGPMGYGMGKLEIVEHDGHGNLKFEERPFVIQRDRAFVNLGDIKHPLARTEMASK